MGTEKGDFKERTSRKLSDDGKNSNPNTDTPVRDSKAPYPTQKMQGTTFGQGNRLSLFFILLPEGH